MAEPASTTTATTTTISADTTPRPPRSINYDGPLPPTGRDTDFEAALRSVGFDDATPGVDISAILAAEVRREMRGDEKTIPSLSLSDLSLLSQSTTTTHTPLKQNRKPGPSPHPPWTRRPPPPKPASM